MRKDIKACDRLRSSAWRAVIRDEIGLRTWYRITGGTEVWDKVWNKVLEAMHEKRH